MIEGFWTVTFATGKNYGAGTVTVHDGHATGGDSSFLYLGSFVDGQDGKISGALHIKRHSNMLPGLIPGLDNYTLEVAGTSDGKTFKLAGTPTGHSSTRVEIKGTKAA